MGKGAFMAEGEVSNFIKLTQKEVQARISQLVLQRASAKLWKKREKHLSCSFEAYNTDDGLTISFSGIVADSSWLNKNVLIQFTFNHVDYFAKGQVVKVRDSDGVKVSLGKYIYKTEKRENERLLTFPHYQAYAYFKLYEDEAQNVLSFNQRKVVDIQAYEKFNTKIEQIQKKTKTEIGELIGFRVLDISKNGISFLIDTKSKSLFQEIHNVAFSLMIDGEMFALNQGKLIYLVDYLNGHLSGNNKYKVGLTFESTDDFTNKLFSLLEERRDMGIVRKQFEDFSDNDET